MNKIDIKKLPFDLAQFLLEGKKLNYNVLKSEPGLVKLKNIHDLEVSKIYVDSEYSPLKENDPHYGKEGYYIIDAIDIIAECDDSYEPEGVLVWLPEYLMYGTWDSDHWHLIVFPGLTWLDIVKEPLKFLNAQWDPGLGGGKYLKAWEKSEFKEGKPF
jgi:hypothetical protein